MTVKHGKILIESTSHGSNEQKRMQPVISDQNVILNNKNLRSVISCTPNDTLTKVVSISGDIYVDNQINLRLLDGSDQVLNKTFTKNSFSYLVSEEFLKKAILEGMVYDKTVPEGIAYAVSLSYPQSDLYVPITLLVNESGVLSMERVESLEDGLPADSVQADL